MGCTCNATEMSRRDLLVAAHCLLREYDGSTLTAAAEIWAEEDLGMVKVDKGTAGFDGILPDGRKLQVKSKKADAHSDAGTYVKLSKATLEQADDLLIVFVDYATCEVTRTIGPVPVGELSDRKGRYYVSDILRQAWSHGAARPSERLTAATRESVAVITKEENDRLNAAGLKQEMPKGWHLGDNPRARWSKVDIDVPDVQQGKSLEVRQDRWREHAAWVIGQIVEWQAEGMDYRRIAALLNRGGAAAPRGGTWQANEVRRIWYLIASESLQYVLPVGESEAAWVIGQIVEWQAEGMGYRRIAALLNRGGAAAPRGGTWQAKQVRRIWYLVASESLQYVLPMETCEPGMAEP